MRCVAYTPHRHPDDLRRAHMFVDLGVPADDLRASMAKLLQTAQAEGLLVHIHERHSYWELAGEKLQHLRRPGEPGAQAVNDGGRAVTAALPAGTSVTDTRVHFYTSTTATMLAHRDGGSAHPFPSSSMSGPMPACAVKLASWPPRQ